MTPPEPPERTPVQRRRPTIGDVAERAGVSKTTVSFVMNDRPNTGILPETRQRVLDAIRDLGYVPSQMARGLGSRRTGMLGYHVLSEELDEAQLYSLSLFQALLGAADTRGYQIVAFTARRLEDAAARMRTMIAGHAVDGFILHDVMDPDPRLELLTQTGFPFAVWGRTRPDQPQAWVELDQHAAFHAVVDHLIGRGHQRIGFVGSTRRGLWWADREDAVRERLRAHRLRLDDRDVVRGVGDDLDTALDAVLARPDRPTALITAGDLLAVRAYRAAARAGLTIGTDLAITGFDPLLRWLEPPLTTLTLSFSDVAETLVRRCLREVDGPTGLPGEWIVPGLRVGAST